MAKGTIHFHYLRQQNLWKLHCTHVHKSEAYIIAYIEHNYADEKYTHKSAVWMCLRLDVLLRNASNAAFRLACRSQHCRFDGDFCATAQAPLAAEGRPGGKQRQNNQSITSPLCPKQQTVDFYSTWERCHVVKRPKRRGRWELQLWNGKRLSAMKRQCGMQQASLKAALSWSSSVVKVTLAYLLYELEVICGISKA